MVAVLRIDPDEDLDSLGRPAARPEIHAVPRPVVVHRHTRPRTSRSRAAIFWRRRLMAAAVGLGMVLTAAHASAAALGGSTTISSERSSPHVATIVVQSGDSLWSIATRLAPHDDPRAVVDAIATARGSSDLRPGDTITWPAK